MPSAAPATRITFSHVLDVALVMTGGAVVGLLGALLGLGGGIFLVPLLTLGVGLPFRQAVAISLLGVIATSSTIAATSAAERAINVRLGMFLEVATLVGGLAGGLTALALSQHTLHVLFGGVAAAIAMVMLCQRNGGTFVGLNSASP